MKSSLSTDEVVSDSFDNAYLIVIHGFGSHSEYDELLSGIKKMGGVCMQNISHKTQLYCVQQKWLTQIF